MTDILDGNIKFNSGFEWQKGDKSCIRLGAFVLCLSFKDQQLETCTYLLITFLCCPFSWELRAGFVFLCFHVSVFPCFSQHPFYLDNNPLGKGRLRVCVWSKGTSYMCTQNEIYQDSQFLPIVSAAGPPLPSQTAWQKGGYLSLNGNCHIPGSREGGGSLRNACSTANWGIRHHPLM